MARRKVADPVGIASWEEADRLLGQIAERRREEERIRLELESRIAVMKNNAQLAIKEHDAFISAGEKRLAMFARLHEGDFGKSRSRKLTHGTIGFRASTRVRLLLSEADVLTRLIHMGHADCVITKAPTVDKGAVRRLPEDDLAQAGIQLETRDSFYWESDETELPSMEEAQA